MSKILCKIIGHKWFTRVHFVERNEKLQVCERCNPSVDWMDVNVLVRRVLNTKTNEVNLDRLGVYDDFMTDWAISIYAPELFFLPPSN